MIIGKAVDQDFSGLRKRASDPVSAGTHRVLVRGDDGVDRLIDESNFHRYRRFELYVQCY